MPVFVYQAADRRGQTIDGVMEAPDARAVVERLQKDSYFPIRVVPHAERARWLAFGVSARVGQRDLLALTQQLATLVESALPLDRALAIQEELAPNPRLKAIVTDLLNSVRGGSSLSEALAKHHPRPFSRLYINMVRAGEKGGVLEVTLRRLAEFLESRAAFAEALVSALAYPVVIFSVGIGAIVFLMTFVIPRFATIFADLGRPCRCRPRSCCRSARASSSTGGCCSSRSSPRSSRGASGRGHPRGASRGTRHCSGCRSSGRSRRGWRRRASRGRSARCSRAACRSWARSPSWATR